MRHHNSSHVPSPLPEFARSVAGVRPSVVWETLARLGAGANMAAAAMGVTEEYATRNLEDARSRIRLRNVTERDGEMSSNWFACLRMGAAQGKRSSRHEHDHI